MFPYCAQGLSWVWPFGWLIFILVIMVMSRLIWGGRRSRRDWRYQNHESAPQDPVATLKNRYARGDITKDEYESIRRDLEK